MSENLAHIILRLPVFDRIIDEESWWDYFNRKTSGMSHFDHAESQEYILFDSPGVTHLDKGDIWSWRGGLSFHQKMNSEKVLKDELYINFRYRMVDAHIEECDEALDLDALIDDEIKRQLDDDFKGFAEQLRAVTGIDFAYEKVLVCEDKYKTVLIIEDLDRLLERREALLLKKTVSDKPMRETQDFGL